MKNNFEQKRRAVTELLKAQTDLAYSVGDFHRYFDADQRIRRARRELRRLEGESESD